MKFKVGDIVVFTQKTPNDSYHNALAIITSVDNTPYVWYKMFLTIPGTHKSGNVRREWIRHLTKLERELS